VKLVASLGIGTIAAGVAKAGADYVQVSGHAGGTGASPLSSIKHVGAPWELGLAEVHQVLIRNALRDRVSLRTDGGLQTGRDVLIAALLGAEEFGFGTAALIAIGCDMARQCHLDTCPTGVATQREDLRAKFSGSPDDVARFFLAVAHDVQRELAAAGLHSIAEAVGRTELLSVRDVSSATLDLSALLSAPDWTATPERRAHASSSRAVVSREPASVVENRLAAELLRLPSISMEDGTHIERPDERIPETDEHEPTAEITTADRSLGAHVSGLIERGLVRRPVSWLLHGSAGQSFGAFAGPSVRLALQGQANDYVGKGLSGGTIVLRPEDELLENASDHAIAGNTCLYGATGGRLHVVGRAGMRFAVRNSGARAVVEGIGPHGCEYMTGGAVVVLGSVGRNFCAGMTGGRVYLHDPAGESVGAVDRFSVSAVRLGEAAASRDDGHVLLHELHDLLRDHAAAGSVVASSLLREAAALAETIWVIEPLVAAAVPAPPPGRGIAVPPGDVPANP
jgi:glutamate synthase (ferredoxin)